MTHLRPRRPSPNLAQPARRQSPPPVRARSQGCLLRLRLRCAALRYVTSRCVEACGKQEATLP